MQEQPTSLLFGLEHGGSEKKTYDADRGRQSRRAENRKRAAVGKQLPNHRTRSNSGSVARRTAHHLRVSLTLPLSLPFVSCLKSRIHPAHPIASKHCTILSLLSLSLTTTKPTMAGYFSNHSQSRFLANSTNNNTSGTTTMTTTAPAAGRTRISASRHFSTSVSASSSGDEKEKLAGSREGSINGFAKGEPHPLRHTCVHPMPHFILVSN